MMIGNRGDDGTMFKASTVTFGMKMWDSRVGFSSHSVNYQGALLFSNVGGHLDEYIIRATMIQVYSLDFFTKFQVSCNKWNFYNVIHCTILKLHKFI